MTTTSHTTAPGRSPAEKRRVILGIGVWALVWVLAIALVPLVTRSALSASVKASLTGLLLLGLPKIGLVAAIALMGRPGFAYVKATVFGYLKPPAEVGPVRYRMGIILFVSVVAYGWLDPYLGSILPGAEQHPRAYALAGDLLLLASLFVLGGDFWDKLRALFVRTATVVFPGDATSRQPQEGTAKGGRAE